MSSHWSLCPHIGQQVLSLVIMSSHWSLNPLISHQILSLVINHWSLCPLICHHVLKVIMSSHWIGHQVIMLSSQLMIFSEMVRELVKFPSRQ